MDSCSIDLNIDLGVVRQSHRNVIDPGEHVYQIAIGINQQSDVGTTGKNPIPLPSSLSDRNSRFKSRS